MSHVSTKQPASADTAITDLEAVAAAAARCGLEFKKGQTTHRVYNGKESPCQHALVWPASLKNTYGAYEIGLVPSKKFDGFALATDFYGGKVEQAVGPQFDTLLMYYQMERARRVARQNGDVYQEIKLPGGGFRVEVDTTLRMNA